MGMDFRGLKTGVENDTFWSEIGSGFGEPGGTVLPPRIPWSTPRGPSHTKRWISSVHNHYPVQWEACMDNEQLNYNYMR